jgi:hypothetical protein
MHLNLQSKRRLFLLMLFVAAILALWLDHAHPFVIRVIRNGHQTAMAVCAIL